LVVFSLFNPSFISIRPQSPKRVSQQKQPPSNKEVYFAFSLRESATVGRKLRESAINYADSNSYRLKRTWINLARNSKSTLRGEKMTLATVAYRMASDADFASMLQKQPDVAIANAGIKLSEDEKMVIQAITQIPGNMIRLVENIVMAESWAVGG
jgi:hypothetical protein